MPIRRNNKIIRVTYPEFVIPDKQLIFAIENSSIKK